MFDKAEYKKRRAQGLRGQGDKPKSTVTIEQPGGYLGSGGMVNRKQHRRKVRSGFHTTKHAVYQKTNEELAATRERVQRKEAGEKERIAKKLAKINE